ncbi:zinc finger protein 2 isoform X2 [Musca domestica]|nr:zinc finger protein 2 isoform X2 [Musca domestica]
MFTVDTESVPVFTSRSEASSPHTSSDSRQVNPRIHTFKIIKASDVSVRYHKIRNTLLKSLKPILMCFICKLSFGVTKLFVVHANKEHGIYLKEFERALLLNRNNASAIIQRSMDENPQISFLEPNNSESKYMITTSESEKQLTNSDDDPSSISMENFSIDKSLVPASNRCDKNLHSKDSPIYKMQNVNNSDSNAAIKPTTNEQRPISGYSLTKNDDKNIIWTPNKDSETNVTGQSLQMSALHASWFVLSTEQNFGNVQSISDFIQHNILAQHQQQRNDITLTSGKEFLSSLGNSCLLHGEKQGIECKVCEMDKIRLKHKENANKNVTCISPCSTNSTVKMSSHRQILPTPSFAIGACSDHINGRPLNVECLRCELIINSARINAGAQQSSRNSCKTLKCPQCNWHYKYQETLEIHMREKHPEGESACGYCLAGQQHPRLARGESYSCGYKPYRCDICNYSTTTKGNLSIHMQSDKHLNNVQELNSSRTIITSSDATNSIMKLDALAATYISHYHTMPKHRPQMDVGSGETSALKAHEKEGGLDKSGPVFRCDMCNYETTMARNLRIHMTCEKHMQNLTILQNNIKNIQALSLLQQHQSQILPKNDEFDCVVSRTDVNLKTIEANSKPDMDTIKQTFDSVSDFGRSDHITSSESNKGFPFKKQMWPTELYSCLICENFNTNDVDALYQHLIIDRSVEIDSKENPKLIPTNILSEKIRSTSCASPDTHVTYNNDYVCILCNYKTNLKANFQLHSKTDKHLQKLNFFNHLREGGMANRNKIKYYQQHMGINVIQIKCNCCDMLLNSIFQLKLHIKHSRHEGMELLFLHLNRIIRNNTDEKQHSSKLEKSRIRNKNICCKMCNIAVGSLIKMVNHVKTRHLSQMETLLRMGTDGESFAKALEEMVCLSDVVENDETAKEIYERNSSPENNLSDAGTEQTCSNNHTDDIFNLECNSDSFHNIDVKDIAYSCDF